MESQGVNSSSVVSMASNHRLVKQTHPRIYDRWQLDRLPR